MVRYDPLLAALVANLVFWPAEAQEDQRIRCPSGWSNLANGFDSNCDLVNFDLNGYTASQLMYEIIHESDRSNDTFFNNDDHVTCLFQESTFALEGDVGAGPVSFTIPSFGKQGTLCLYPSDVSRGGLDLGQIRNLTRRYIREQGCSSCGSITVNHNAGNEDLEGTVRIDWRKSSVCLDNCIDPRKDLQVNETETEEEEDDDDDSGASDVGCRCGVLVGVLLSVTALMLLV